MCARPLLDREEAAGIADEFYAVRRANQILEWNPAICALICHIATKLRDSGSFVEQMREKARTSTDKRQIEVPIFSYTRTALVGDTKPWDRVPDDPEACDEYSPKAGDVARRHETTISSLADWVGEVVPVEQRYIPLRKLLAWDTFALGMLAVILGPNIEVVQRSLPAHITTDQYTVYTVELVAKLFLLAEEEDLPMFERTNRERAVQKWFPGHLTSAEQDDSFYDEYNC
jgi:hypothetical protein